MLRSEVLKLSEFATEEIKKPILIRYTIAVDMSKNMPYDEEALRFIQSIKSLPDHLQKVELHYEITDSKYTHLIHQCVSIKVDDASFFELPMDEDLDLFFTFIRLFKHYEDHVESYEQIVTPTMLNRLIDRCHFNEEK